MLLLVSTPVKHNHFLAHSTFYRIGKIVLKVQCAGGQNVTVQGLDQTGCT